MAKFDNNSAPLAPLADLVEVMPKDTAPAVATLAVSSDPDRVVTSVSVKGADVDIVQRDAVRYSGAALKGEIRAVVRAHTHATAIGEGLCSWTEIEDDTDRILYAKIQARRMGYLALPATKKVAATAAN